MSGSAHSNESFFEAIGRISVMFATWDLFVSDLIVQLRPGKPPLFQKNDTLGRKLRLLEELKAAEVKDPETLKSLAPHFVKAKNVAEERNRYIHDQWLFDGNLVLQGRIRRFRLEFEPEVRADWKELTLEDLRLFSDDLWKIQKPFSDAAQKLHPGFFKVFDA